MTKLACEAKAYSLGTCLVKHHTAISYHTAKPVSYVNDIRGVSRSSCLVAIWTSICGRVFLGSKVCSSQRGCTSAMPCTTDILTCCFTTRCSITGYLSIRQEHALWIKAGGHTGFNDSLISSSHVILLTPCINHACQFVQHSVGKHAAACACGHRAVGLKWPLYFRCISAPGNSCRSDATLSWSRGGIRPAFMQTAFHIHEQAGQHRLTCLQPCARITFLRNNYVTVISFSSTGSTWG